MVFLDITGIRWSLRCRMAVRRYPGIGLKPAFGTTTWMAEKYLGDLVIGFDEYFSVDTRTTAKKVSVKFIRASSDALIKVSIKPLAEKIKHSVGNHGAVIALIVADRGNRIKARQLTGPKFVGDSVALKLFEGVKPYVPNLFRRHAFPLDLCRSRRLRLNLSCRSGHPSSVSWSRQPCRISSLRVVSAGKQGRIREKMQRILGIPGTPYESSGWPGGSNLHSSQTPRESVGTARPAGWRRFCVHPGG